MTKNFKSRLKDGYLSPDQFEKGNKTHDKDMDYEGVRDGRTAIAGINRNGILRKIFNMGVLA